MESLSTLETYFARFRDQVIGREQTFESPYGTQKMLYVDWTAAGRAYQPIEDYLQQQILPFAANTHTGSTVTSSIISQTYQEAKATIKQHVRAGDDDVLIFCGSGMTAAVNKLQRLLGLRIPGQLKDYLSTSLPIKEELRPVVFVTHMEHPGGGTITYSNPWGDRHYTDNIEEREDGGTPPFLQGIKAALCIRLKESMGTKHIRNREKELLAIIFQRFKKIKNATVLEGSVTDRLGIVSFIIRDAHYNLVVKLLNDRFGIQTRGGCSCASTYGHYLLGVSQKDSRKILQDILAGNLQAKPGWTRLSVHPTMTDGEIHLIMDAIEQVAANHAKWGMDYHYCQTNNEFRSIIEADSRKTSYADSLHLLDRFSS